MKTQIRKFLQITLIIAGFCIASYVCSVENDVITLNEGIIYFILTLIYMGIASLVCMFISVSEDKP